MWSGWVLPVEPAAIMSMLVAVDAGALASTVIAARDMRLAKVGVCITAQPYCRKYQK